MSVLCMKCSNPKRGLHNAKWMITMGRKPVCYQAIDMWVETRHIVIYEEGAEDFARIDPHWREHDFIPVTIEELEELNRQQDEKLKDRPLAQEVMPKDRLHIDDFHFHILEDDDLEWAKKRIEEKDNE